MNSRTASLRVLIVEDQADDALLMHHELRRAGLNISSERVDDIHGLRSELGSEWDVVLADYSLPSLDVATTLAAVRELDSPPPVIVVSGAIGEEQAAELMRMGVADVVNKSHLERLSPVVKRTIADAKVQRARRQAEIALQESENRYRSLFNNLPVGVFRVGPDGRVLSANPHLRKMLGLRSTYDVVRSSVADFLIEPTTMRSLTQEVASNAGTLETELQLRRAGGETFWGLLRITASTEIDGSETHFDGILIDVTQQKELKHALIRGKEDWERTFDAVKEYVVIVDEDTKITRSNRLLTDRLNTPFSALLGRPAAEVLGWDEDSENMPSLQEIVLSNRALEVDVSSEILGGEFRFSVTPRPGVDGLPSGAILVGRDVTAARQEEHLRRLRTTIDQAEYIFRTLRHEVGNALNTLKTTLSVFRMRIDGFTDEQKSTYFERCMASLGIAERLLQSLRSYQTFDRVRPQEIDISSFLENRLDLVFEKARSQGIDCSSSVCPEKCMVMADSDALVRVLVNLVDNASAALDSRPWPSIRVSCHPTSTHAGVTISDNGQGIPEEELHQIFSPLFTTKPEGLGMGLAIVQKLMVKMNGFAAVHSEVNKGTTFTLTLPRCDVDVDDGVTP